MEYARKSIPLYLRGHHVTRRAQAELKKGFKMEKQNLDEYVAKFERLVQHAGYDFDNLQTINLFTAGLPNQLYQKIYDLNDPQTYNQWKTCVMIWTLQ